MYGLRQQKTNTCCKCKVQVRSTDTVLLCNLLYPEPAGEATTFEEVVCSSLCPDQTTPAWCEKCRKYQPTQQARVPLAMPYVLSLNTGMDNQQDVDFWRAQMQALYDRHKPEEEQETTEAAGTQPQPPPPPPPPANAKPCRYGLGCNRPDCKFWHPQQQDGGGAAGGAEAATDVGDQLARLGISWVPHELNLALMEGGKVESVTGRREQEEKPEEEKKRKKYKL